MTNFSTSREILLSVSSSTDSVVFLIKPRSFHPYYLAMMSILSLEFSVRFRFSFFPSWSICFLLFFDMVYLMVYFEILGFVCKNAIRLWVGCLVHGKFLFLFIGGFEGVMDLVGQGRTSFRSRCCRLFVLLFINGI